MVGIDIVVPNQHIIIYNIVGDVIILAIGKIYLNISNPKLTEGNIIPTIYSTQIQNISWVVIDIGEVTCIQHDRIGQRIGTWYNSQVVGIGFSNI